MGYGDNIFEDVIRRGIEEELQRQPGETALDSGNLVKIAADQCVAGRRAGHHGHLLLQMGS